MSDERHPTAVSEPQTDVRGGAAPGAEAASPELQRMAVRAQWLALLAVLLAGAALARPLFEDDVLRGRALTLSAPDSGVTIALAAGADAATFTIRDGAAPLFELQAARSTGATLALHDASRHGGPPAVTLGPRSGLTLLGEGQQPAVRLAAWPEPTLWLAPAGHSPGLTLPGEVERWCGR